MLDASPTLFHFPRFHTVEAALGRGKALSYKLDCDGGKDGLIRYDASGRYWALLILGSD